MSRGPGVWQRGILAAVEHDGMVSLRDLLPDDARKSERHVVERAAWRLHAEGRIDLLEDVFGRPRLLAARPGMVLTGRPERATQRPRRVGEKPSQVFARTYRDFTMQVDARIGGDWPGRRHTRHCSKQSDKAVVGAKHAQREDAR